jgi:hypothetical protein
MIMPSIASAVSKKSCMATGSSLTANTQDMNGTLTAVQPCYEHWTGWMDVEGPIKIVLYGFAHN